MFSRIKDLFLITKKKYKYVIFSENKFYQKYFLNFAKSLASHNEVVYLSCDRSDRIDYKNIINIYIGKKPFNLIFLNILRCNNFFMTLTDLNNHFLKKNKNVENYIYIFHSLISIHKGYTSSAFDNYDIVFCPGKKHKQELLKTEEVNNSKKKSLYEIGYFYLDYLKSIKQEDFNSNTILIAPSWNYADENFTELILEKLITKILENNYKIIFRPHPEQIKRQRSTIEKINQKFKKFPNYTYDINKDNLDSLIKAKIVITDNSGIAIEAILGLNKPVIYCDKYLKIHNKNYEKISPKSLEDEIKENFGVTINDFEVINFKNIISYTEKNLQSKKLQIDEFVKNEIYNSNDSVIKAIELIKEN